MISAENLFYTYELANNTKINAVENVSFNLEKGKALGIVGKTGSGKSTLVSMLNGLLVPTKGKVFLNSKDINKDFKNKQEVKFKIGLVFQYPENQLFESSVYDDIAFGLRNKGLDDYKIKLEIEEVSETLQISKKVINSSPFSLSGGEKRKCALAGTLVLKPEVLILDEPTSALDFNVKMNLLNCLKNYCKKEKNSVVFISHVMEEVVEIADDILVMKDGKSAYYGKTTDLFNEYENIEIKVPQILEIMSIINSKGYNVSKNIFSLSEAKEELLKLLKRGGNI